MKKPLAHREDLDHIIFSAFRYALGRCTYMSWVTTQFIKNNIDLVPTKFRNLMIKEITDAEERDALGWDCDKVEWLKLREFLKESLKGDK